MAPWEDDELEGASLPPQVAGERLGSVRLRVPHVLEAAAAPRALPRVVLVRVRWWGEVAPGSLFRPMLLAPGDESAAGEQLYSPRTTAVRYPVRVPADRLLEYFSDMKTLQMDVVDRVTRKKIGVCSLPLQVQSEMMVGVRSEDRLATLHRENSLCEIHSVDPAEAHVVLGYLAVDFEITWTDSDLGSPKMLWGPPTSVRVSAPNEPQIRVNGVPRNFDLPVNRFVEWGDNEDEANLKTSAGAFNADYREAGIYTKQADNVVGAAEDDHQPVNEEETTAKGIRDLIEKGHALKQRMEQAIRLGGLVEVGQAAPIPGLSAVTSESTTAVREEFMPLPHINVGEEPTNSVGDASDQIVNDDNGVESEDGWVHSQNDGRYVDAPSIEEPINPFPERKLCSCSLEISIQELRCKDTLIEQLRLLRDPSNSNSRFSPIQITVYHTDISSLFQPDEHSKSATNNELPAFSVSTSLRKLQWQPGYSRVSLLNIPLNEEMDEWLDDQAPIYPRLKFRVHCVNQSDAQQAIRRRKRGLFPRPVGSVDLHGSLDVKNLLDQLRSHDRVVTKVPLFLIETAMTGLKDKRRRPHAQALMEVGFRLLEHMNESDPIEETDGGNATQMKSEFKVHESADFDLSEVSVNESSVSPREVQSQLDGLELAVMFDSVAVAKPTSSSNPNFSKSALTIQYSIPADLSDRLTIVRRREKIEHKIKCQLTRQESASSFSYISYLGRNCKVFPSKFHSDSVDYFDRGILVMEVWESTNDEELASLLGIVKLELKPFGLFLRSTNGVGLYNQTIPFTGISGSFSIQNPFTGSVVGQIRLHICVGFAHQINVWSSTLRAITAFQAISRGVMCRLRLGIDSTRVRHSPIFPNKLLSDTPREIDNTHDGHSTTTAKVTNHQDSSTTTPLRLDIDIGDISNTKAVVGDRSIQDTISMVADNQDAAPILESQHVPQKNEIVAPRSHTIPDDTKVLHEERFPNQIQVSVEEVRNVLEIDNETFSGDDITPGAFVSWRMMSSSGDSAAYHPVARTHVTPLSTSAIWKTMRVTRVNASDWKDPILEVVLWQTSIWNGMEQQSPSKSNLSSVVGKAQVDLGLLGRRWTFVDGWYHLLDAKGINRGQIKVRVDLPDEFKLHFLSEKSDWQDGEAVENLPSPGFSDFDAASGPMSIQGSDRDSDKASLRDDAETSHVFGLQDHEPYSAPNLTPAVIDSDVAKPVQPVLDQCEERYVSNNDIDPPTPKRTLPNHLAQSVPLQPEAHFDDHMGEEPTELQEVIDTEVNGVEEESLTFDSGMFQPITLASFGITLVELSPISSASNASMSIHPMELSPSSSTSNASMPIHPLSSMESEPPRIEVLDGDDTNSDFHSVNPDDVASVSSHPVSEVGISNLSTDDELDEQNYGHGNDEDVPGVHSISCMLAEESQGDGEDTLPEESAGSPMQNGNDVSDCLNVLSAIAVNAVSPTATTLTSDNVHNDAVMAPIAVSESDSMNGAEVVMGTDDVLQVSSNKKFEDKAVQANFDSPLSETASDQMCTSAIEEDPLEHASVQEEACDNGNDAFGSVDEFLEPNMVDAYTQISCEGSVSSDLPDVSNDPVVSAEEAEDNILSSSACSEGSASTAIANSQPANLVSDTASIVTSDCQPQQACEVTKDRLDVVIELLHEILAVCVQNKSAVAANATEINIPQPVGISEALRETQLPSDTRDACDEPTASEVTAENVESYGSTSALTVSFHGSEVRADLEPRFTDHPLQTPATASVEDHKSEFHQEDQNIEANLSHAGAADELYNHGEQVSMQPQSDSSLSSLSIISKKNTVNNSTKGNLSRNDLWMSHLKSSVRSCTSCQQEETPRARLHAEKRSSRMFPHDSETERIARIMQGTLAYWMKEGGDSSEDPSDSDDSDSDYLF